MEIKNVKIVNFNHTINNANIELEDGKIKRIIKIDGIGDRTIIPGFIDTHIHGLLGNDFMDGRDAAEKIAYDVTKFGVTSIYATIMTSDLESMYRTLEDISESKSKGANILGIHSEGPFISVEKKGAHNAEQIIPGNERVLMKMFNASNGMLKKITFSPETSSNDFINKMTELKILPSIGHSNASFKRTIEAIELGSLECTHLWNAMSGIQNRNPGVAEAVIYDDRVYAELITDFIHVDMDTVMFTLKAKGVDKIMLVTDSIRPAGLPDGESKSGGLIVNKDGSKIIIKGTNTIAGSGETMIDCFRNLIKLGIRMEDAVKMSSYNAAKSCGMNGKGLIQEGMDADLLILQNDLKIDSVFVKGKKIDN